MRNTPILFATAVASALFLAACGGDEDATTSVSDASNTTTAESMDPSPSAEDSPARSETITDIVAGNPNFSTLLTAVEAAGLSETLAGDGPYTVFAPTNEAFAELPPKALKALLRPANQDQLTAILTYHVVPAEVMAADVKAGEVTTVNSAPFTVALEDGGVTITDGQGDQANVTDTDIDAANGVIHVIDSVLQPAA
jgi:uncharacterized surface protein with fasciclin (FAS1) repeats